MGWLRPTLAGLGFHDLRVLEPEPGRTSLIAAWGNGVGRPWSGAVTWTSCPRAIPVAELEQAAWLYAAIISRFLSPAGGAGPWLGGDF